jgi:hypothetical protein
MKIYLAMRYAQVTKYKKLCSELRSKGHEITVDWSEQLNIKPYEKHPKLSEECALRDLKGVEAADTFILVAEYFPDARGILIELGYALRIAQEKKLKIIVVNKERNSVFYYHPLITRVKTIEEAFSLL